MLVELDGCNIAADRDAGASATNDSVCSLLTNPVDQKRLNGEQDRDGEHRAGRGNEDHFEAVRFPSAFSAISIMRHTASHARWLAVEPGQQPDQ